MNTLSHYPRRVLSALGLGALLAMATMTPIHAEEEAAEDENAPVHISREANGLVVLTLDAETQQRIALTVTAAEATSLQPTVIAFGKLAEDPARSFTLRAPAAGVLKASTDQEWPEIGSIVESNTILGYVEPRFTASEMVDLCARRLDAQADFDAIGADVEAAYASYEGKSRLNSGQGLVSDRSMEETRARYKSGEARLLAARRKVELYESLVAGRAPESALFPISTFASGEVVEVPAQPGETVDAGQVLLRTARFDVLIANVSVFVGETVESAASEAQIVVAGADGLVLVGKPIGPASEASALTGGQALLFEVDVPAERRLRPGVAVTAHVPTHGAPMNGVLIPRSAVLRHGGRTWAYVKTGEVRLERRDVVLYRPTSDGWFVTSGVSPGENVVVDGAQLLLSEELKAQIESEEEAGE